MIQFGWVDVLVNNVGVSTAVPATRETPERFRSVIDIYLRKADLIGLTRDLAQQWTGRKGIRVNDASSYIIGITLPVNGDILTS